MNAYAFTELQKIIAEKISENIGKTVTVGRYVDISDSLHIYGSSFDVMSKEIDKMKTTPFTERSWDSNHHVFEIMTTEARRQLANDPDFYAKAKHS